MSFDLWAVTSGKTSLTVQRQLTCPAKIIDAPAKMGKRHTEAVLTA